MTIFNTTICFAGSLIYVISSADSLGCLVFSADSLMPAISSDDSLICGGCDHEEEARDTDGRVDHDVKHHHVPDRDAEASEGVVREKDEE